jgi:hypothetical protein
MESLARLVVVLFVIAILLSFGSGICISMYFQGQTYKYVALGLSTLAISIFGPFPTNIKVFLSLVLVSGYMANELVFKLF